MQFQSLEASVNQMRNDLGSINTDMGMVRTKCEEIDKRCHTLETNYHRLSSTVQDTNADLGEPVDEKERGHKQRQQGSSQGSKTESSTPGSVKKLLSRFWKSTNRTGRTPATPPRALSQGC